MKIAMVSLYASPLATAGEVDCGDQSQHVAELSAALARLGHDVTVYTRRMEPELPDTVLVGPGLAVEQIQAGPLGPVGRDDLLPHLNEFASELSRRWRQRRPDVVHAHYWMSGLASMLATVGLGVPMVQTFHSLGAVQRRQESEVDAGPPERLRLEPLVGRRANAVTAMSSAEVTELTRIGVPRSRISVVPCGVDVRRFCPVGPRAKRGDCRRLLSVGRLQPRRGFDLVVTALRRVPETELVIAGGWRRGSEDVDNEVQRLWRHAVAAGVDDRVRLTGGLSRADLPALLRSADVVVCAPWHEPLGAVPLEAMACAVPVVGTAAGALTDTVITGVTGVLVPHRDVRALADTLRALVGDPALREAYGTAGRDRARARYSWSLIAADTVLVYGRAGASTTASAPSSSGHRAVVQRFS